jgi:uncharacterized membrane protein
MILGCTLLLASWMVLLALTIRLLAPSFLIALVAYGSSVAGLVMGVFGAFQYVHQVRSR